MVNSTKFAKRLEKILEYYGISATAFSETIAVNRSTISHLLSGRNKPSLDFIMKVIQHYPEVELYWLLNGKGSFPANQESPTFPTETTSIEKSEKASSPKITDPATTKMSKSLDLLKSKDTAIDRIVVFFKDGSFKSYEN